MNYIGVDLAWGDGTAIKPAKDTGLACIDASGIVLDAGWARGIEAVVDWLERTARPGDVIASHGLADTVDGGPPRPASLQGTGDVDRAGP